MNYIRSAVLLSMMASVLFPPQTGAGQDRPAVTLKIDTDLVAIDVTAMDRTGNYVRDLRKEDFEVLEDGKARKIEFFSVADEASLSRPIAVVFALDCSGSLKPEETATLREAALKFVDLMKGDAVFATMNFNYDVKITQGFTDDAHKVERAFQRATKFEGSTRIYDAIDRAVTMLVRDAPRTRKNRPVRRVVVVITDGFDSASVIDRRELIRRALEAGVTVYSITLPSFMLSATPNNDRVITPLDAARIVAATGGRDFSANVTDFRPIFRYLVEEIRSSYVLAYYPERRDGKFHEVKVKTTRPGITLRSNRTGYVAPAS
jgi:Ca-activated chloride channel homolog